MNLATLVFGIAFSMMFFGFFFFMTGIWHYSLPQAGLAMTPGPLMVVPVAMIAGRFAARAGHRPLLVTGSLLLAAGGTWQATVPGLQPDYLLHWLPGQLLTGVGVGMALPSLSGAASSSSQRPSSSALQRGADGGGELMLSSRRLTRSWWNARAAATRAATSALRSAEGGRVRSLALTAGTSIARSRRSSSGPDSFAW